MLSRINITFFLVFILFLNNSLLAQEYSFLSPIQLNASRCKSITTADLNKDNAPDIILGTFSPSQINIFLNDGSGNFNTNADFTYPASSRPVGVAVADFNEDNNLDIITANYLDSTLSIFWGSGDGSFYGSDTLKIPYLRA
ncbi:MAG: VCBS repeat-containing protein, partial [Ignavibacteria bacterium]|nr:VCBS repeat-containing protein [Ignavibacteria bacterium]